MAPRRLLYLDGFIRHPVWTFSTVPVLDLVSEEDATRRYYLSVSLPGFTDLWGPVEPRYVGGCTDVVSEIAVRGGVIQAHSHLDQSVIVKEDEIPCRWCGWRDDNSDAWNVEPRPISIVNRLLIGSPDSNHSGISKDQMFFISSVCTCDRGNGLRIPSWTVAERTA
jgi:hypothetical protein